MSGYYSTAEKRRIEGNAGAVTIYDEPASKKAKGPNTEIALIGGAVNRAIQIAVSGYVLRLVGIIN